MTARTGPFVGVALDLPMDTLFTYRVPDPWRDRVRVGQRVRVSFRNKKLVGLVAEIQHECALARVLDVESFPDDEPLLPPDLLKLGRFVASYYGSSIGEAYAAMIPRGVRTRNKGATRKRVRLLKAEKEAVAHADALPTPQNAQARVLRLLAKEPNGVLLQDLVRRAKVSSSPIKTLATAGWVVILEESASDDPLVEATRSPIHEPVPTTLHPSQTKALDAVVAALHAKTFAPFLLLGVTGSGKTEVYLRAINACRAQGRQTIVLVPEIALTPQTVRRFRARIDRVAVLHSGMSEADRAASWRAIRAGDADVVIGPRSAVFAPVPSLGLLILDEEHETSFKQQNAPRYHARDVGLVRARESGAVVVLGSATPSLEAYRHALDGKFRLLELPERVENRPLPPVRIIDLKADGERLGGGRQIGRTLLGRLEGRDLPRRPGDPVPEPPRLRDERVLPALRVRRPLPGLRHGAHLPPRRVGRALPPLRPRGPPAEVVPRVRLPLAQAARRGHGDDRGGARAGARGRDRRADGLRHDDRPRRLHGGPRPLRPRRGEDPPRHADDREGAPLPERDARGRDLGRHEPRARRLPRGRAHVRPARAGRRAARAAATRAAR